MVKIKVIGICNACGKIIKSNEKYKVINGKINDKLTHEKCEVKQLVRCINADRCLINCKHKTPHEKINNGGFNYSYHNCIDEKTLMCGKDKNGYSLDGNCQKI